jgi:hypothetical protein
MRHPSSGADASNPTDRQFDGERLTGGKYGNGGELRQQEQEEAMRRAGLTAVFLTVAAWAAAADADGHGGNSNARVVKFSKEGKFITAWGKKGTGSGEFDTPHAIAVDSHERVYVADRSNSRIQAFDADGKFIADWKQFGRPSGVYVDGNDVIYVADSQTADKTGCTPDPGCRRGIRIGNAADGTVKYFIPRPDGGPVGPEGVSADANGVVYGASNEGKRIVRYSKK